MTVAENVALPLKEHTNLAKDEIDRRVHDKLRLVNLDEHADKYPSEISGGMKKRAGLARAIVREPEILLYDEPTSGLDPVMSRGVDRLVVKMQRELGVTSILVTHDMESAYLCADRIAMLYQGRVQQMGTADEIKRSRDPVVRAFIRGDELPDPSMATPPDTGSMHMIARAPDDDDETDGGPDHEGLHRVPGTPTGTQGWR
jgi:phospholipid/cholesterol/gamma-HCH transport system ATP-binding protein